MADRPPLGETPLQTGVIAGSIGLGTLFLVAVASTGSPNPSIDTEAVEATALPASVSEIPDLTWTMDLSSLAQPDHTMVTGELRRGDTLSDLLMRLGASSSEAHRALNSAFEADLIDPRRVRPGLSATLTLEQGEGDNTGLVGVSLRQDSDHSFLITRASDGEFDATRLDVRLEPQIQRVAGAIETSLYMAALNGGARDQQVADFAKIFAYDLDFQREIHPGDRFEIVYESLVDERGNPVRMGDVLYAELDGRVFNRAFYRFTTEDDYVTDYYDINGESATKFLMKTPINGARLSSHFGNRRHPISGYTRLHKGTDFAAPTGTPIYAAGHGVVERASRYGGYGHYVRIQHANGYETAYAHLSRYGSGIRSGVRVRQGDVIGYVGSTGASTGPHLHYEVIINGEHVNAMSLNFPTGRKLEETPEVMDDFIEYRRALDLMRLSMGAEIDVAELPENPNLPSEG